MASDNRPAPVKRAVSFQQTPADHSPSPRRQSPHQSGAVEQPHKLAAHKPHRPYVVGAQRTHGRNLSNKSLNKLQRLALTHTLAADGTEAPTTPTLHRHQRKKSAPVSPSTSPRTSSQVRRNGSATSLAAHAPNSSIKRNLSTPVLRRNVSSNLAKKNPPSSKHAKGGKTEQKKTVGFELANSDDEDEWEDNSSHSNSSTRRNSLTATGKMNGDKDTQPPSALTKPPLAQENESTDALKPREESQAASAQSQYTKRPGQEDIATRILNRPQSSKAPPAISSISATAKPAATDRAVYNNSSFVNLSSSLTGGDHASSPTMNPQGTSSSAEGGVSRFLPKGNDLGAQSASNPSAPSSFLPHYHPNTPPSPDVVSKRPKSPTSSRRQPAEPASRTQQKLWLQRTATLSTSPPGSSVGELRSATSTSAINDGYTPDHSRSGPGAYDHDGRRGVIGAPGPPAVDSEAKRIRKVYDRLTSELSVVERFRSPAIDSFARLLEFLGPDGRESSSRGRDQVNGHATTSSEPHSRAVSRTRDPGARTSTQSLTKPRTGGGASQVRFQDQYYIVNMGDAEQPAENPDVEHQFQPNNVAVVLPDGNVEEQLDDTTDPHVPEGYANGLGTSRRRYHPTAEEMLLRRLWESREVAVEGD